MADKIGIYIVGPLIGCIIVVIAILILTLPHWGWMIIGGAILGIGLACLNSGLNQGWNRFQRGLKADKFSWRSYKNQALIGLSTGLITSIISTIRVQYTLEIQGFELILIVVGFEIIGAILSGFVSQIFIIWQTRGKDYFTMDLCIFILICIGAIIAGTLVSFVWNIIWKFISEFIWKLICTYILHCEGSNQRQSLIVSILLGASLSAATAALLTATFTILGNIVLVRLRKISRHQFICFIGDDNEGNKIWDTLIANKIIVIQNPNNDSNVQEDTQSNKTKKEYGQGRVSKTYQEKDYKEISPLYDKAVKQYLDRYQNYKYNLFKNIFISTTVGFFMGIMIGVAQYRYSIQQEEIQVQQEQNIQEFSKEVGKDPKTVTVETLNIEAQKMSQKYQADADLYTQDATNTSDPTQKAMLLAEAQKSQRQADYFSGMVTKNQETIKESNIIVQEQDFTVMKQSQLAMILYQVKMVDTIKEPSQALKGGGNRVNKEQAKMLIKNVVAQQKFQDKDETRHIEKHYEGIQRNSCNQTEGTQNTESDQSMNGLK